MVRHIATLWEVLSGPGFLVAARIHSEVPRRFGSRLTSRCQGSVGVFSLALEMELVFSSTRLVPPKAFPSKFRCTFQDLHVPSASCLCLSQWNVFFSILSVEAADCPDSWDSCHRLCPGMAHYNKTSLVFISPRSQGTSAKDGQFPEPHSL